METSGTYWEVAVPDFHVKCRVYHVDALAMASVIGSGGGSMAFGMMCIVKLFLHFTRHRFLKCPFTSTKILLNFEQKNLVM